jgi:hypothetical protein
MRICSIDGCGRRHKAHGFCVRHVLRWKKHGHPLSGAAKTERGEPKRWLLAHVEHQGDECLMWPFSSMSNGYPWIWWEGRGTGAHRVMCEIIHGPAPTDAHEAAHSCGNGAKGCINGKHLRWATPLENTREKEQHGTVVHGSKIKWAKLTEGEVAQIRAMFDTHSDIEIASQFGVSDSSIYLIRIGRNWKRAA